MFDNLTSESFPFSRCGKVYCARHRHPDQSKGQQEQPHDRIEDQRRKRGSCGRAAPGVELMLFDDDGNEITEPHVEGELFARSPSIFSKLTSDLTCVSPVSMAKSSTRKSSVCRQNAKTELAPQHL